MIDFFCYLIYVFFFLMIRRPPRSTRTDTLFPTRRSSDLARAIDEMDQPPVAAHRGDLHLPVRIAPPEPDQRHRFATVAAFTKASRRIGMAHRQPHVLAKHMRAQQRARGRIGADRKSTRLNSSH